MAETGLGALGRPVEELVRELSAFGPASGVRRAIRALYRGEVEEAWRAPGLSSRLRAALEERRVRGAPPATIRESDSGDGARKLLLGLADGRAVEAVLVPEVRTGASRARMRAANEGDPALERLARRPPRASGCVSTQVGCGAGCAFCASGLEGLARNLTAGEIVGQALALRARARSLGRRLGTLVLMGMGEPFHNTDEVLRALSTLVHPCGAELGASQITVSTVGVVEGIQRLAREGPPTNLAVSLHAPDDETRARIVRLAKHLPPVREVVRAAGDYARATGRFVTASYVLLDGVNDDPDRARLLADLVSRSGVHHVNLIPWNEVPGVPFRASPPERATAFFSVLRERGLPVHFRRARGAGTEAACGQLRRRRDAPAGPGADLGFPPQPQRRSGASGML